MPRNILLIAHDFPPMNGGGCPRPLSFARYLGEFGFHVRVLTRASTLNRPVDYEPLDTLPPSVRIERIQPDFADDWAGFVSQRLRWVRPIERLLRKPKDWVAGGLAWRLCVWRPAMAANLTWLRPALRLGRRLMRHWQPDVVIATGPPFSSLKVGVQLAEQWNVPLVADYRDPWTCEYLWRPRSRHEAHVERGWERRVIDRAARVLLVTPSMVARMHADYPEFSDKFVLLTNGYDDFPPPEDTQRDDSKLTIRHVGTLVGERQPDVLLDAAEILQTTYPLVAADVRIEFVGTSNPPLARQVERRRLSSLVTDVGPVSLYRSKDLMRSADALLICQYSTSVAIAGKCFEYLACTKPILALVPEESDITWLLRHSDNCRFVHAPNPHDIASAICDLWKAWKSHSLGVSHDPSWLQQFHRRELVRQLGEMLLEISGVGRPEKVLA